MQASRPNPTGAVGVDSIITDKPVIRFKHDGKVQEISCDIIAGCDGFHGVCRPSIPANQWRGYDRVYPFGWLGILAESPPPEQELIYSFHERGFALYSMRGPQVSRLYIQCAPDEDIAKWSDDAIWDEMLKRMTTADGWKPNVGPIISKNVTAMRSFVTEPMNAGRLFLAGDAAHIVPPTGAKGLNLAIHDVTLLAQALDRRFNGGSDDLVETYSDRALELVWRSTHFSWWMTSMLHVDHSDPNSAFMHQMQMSQLKYVVSSRAAATGLAENYTGYEG